MIVLDTAHLSCLEWGSDESSHFRELLAELPASEVPVGSKK